MSNKTSAGTTGSPSLLRWERGCVAIKSRRPVSMSAMERRFLPYSGMLMETQRAWYLLWWWWVEGRVRLRVLEVAGSQRLCFDRHGFPKLTTKRDNFTVMSDAIPQSDVSRPFALPTASLLQSKTSTAARLAQSQAQNSAQYLDDIEEEWNKKVDTEIETLVDGMVDIVSLAPVSRPNTSNVTIHGVEHARDSRERQVSDGPGGVPNSMSGRIDGM